MFFPSCQPVLYVITLFKRKEYRMTQKIFTVGNSSVVAIPKNLLAETHFKNGTKVVVEKLPDFDAIVIRPQKMAVTKSAVTKEFHSWLHSFIQEDAEILDRLA
jgi:antitoxin component of MazEF toxin-antitoxin module